MIDFMEVKHKYNLIDKQWVTFLVLLKNNKNRH